MSLLEADQLRRELFVKYHDQIAAVLREDETAEAGDKEPSIAQRFRVSYPRQHIIRQEALHVPDEIKKKCIRTSLSLLGATADEQEEEEEQEEVKMVETMQNDAGKGEVLDDLVIGKGKLEDEDFRPVYNDPFPSVQRMMRRVQHQSLNLLLGESSVPVVPQSGKEYRAQRMAVLEQLERRIGEDRAKTLAKLQKMDGKLHTAEL
ncbi:hypothetical protein ERJ75_001058500 [Trypanosoma vivax]|nr:hypothetical protein ERJ75_001058500 [Trypanosoma vivax]